MAMYPGYKAVDVINEYAITFYALLSEGYRIRYERYEMLATISDLPYAEKQLKIQFYKNLEWASMYPGDILKPSGQGSSPTEIKKLLGG